MLVPVSLPPGVLRNGTQEQSKGRYYNCNHVRWRDGGKLTQMKGWAKRNAQQTALTGKPRACIAWQDNAGARWIAVGTEQKLYVQSAAATVYDITPSAFTTGHADAVILTGYGTGGYGVGTYGTGRPDQGNIIAASMWTLALWNDRLVGVMADDGRVVQWNLVTGTPAGVVTNAPTGVQAIVVTAEGMLMALKNRTVYNSDQADDTVWTPSTTNQARAFPLQTSGSLMCGCRVQGGTLLITTTDAWVANYLGYPLVYGFTRVGSGCGIISRGAFAEMDGRAAWMGREGFFLYDGTVQPLPCAIADLVFADINADQFTKVTSGHRAATGEVWWNYCSAGSTEIDRQVIWNYRLSAALGLSVWYPASLARSCMADAGVFATPVMVSPTGYIYAHETGYAYDGAIPYAETGPLRLGPGDRRMEVQKIVPDDIALGDTTLTFYGHDLPTDDDTTFGPYTLTQPTDVLFQAGRVRLRYDFNGSVEDVIGDFHLDLIPGDPIL